MIDYTSKRMIFFDMDGTLALSKAPIDDDMGLLLNELLEKRDVCVISGGGWRQFEKQLIERLSLAPEKLSHLFISTGGGSSMYRFENGEVHEMYANLLSKEDKARIMQAFDYALPLGGYEKPTETFGELIEDRGSQISFSALGQTAPLEKKAVWDPDHAKRQKIVAFLQEKIPDFEIKMGGTTTIDITKQGVDKAYGIRQASERLGIPIDEMLYIGDALYPGGNDEPAKASGIDCVQVKDVDETKKVIREIINT